MADVSRGTFSDWPLCAIDAESTLSLSLVMLSRLLNRQMLNYDACVRLVELHCRRAEAAEAPTGRRKLSPPHWDTNATTKVAAGEGTESVSGGDSGALKTSLVGREKSMKLWLLNQPIFAARDINR